MQKFTRWISRAGLLGFLLALCSPVWAQYTTATQDGIINSGSEYNNNEFVTRNGSTTSGSWFISWDADKLYLAKNGGNQNEQHFVYLDTDPVQPVTDVSGSQGGNAQGNLTGTTDFGVTPQLPFRADVRIYFRDTYAEFRFRDGNGNWGNPSYSTISYYVNTSGGVGGARELAINWSAISPSGSIPSNFNWFAYQTDPQNGNANYRYDQAPGNGSSFANGNTTPAFEYYFTVVSTASGYYPTATNSRPVSNSSFTARRDISYTSFNTINVWDFTMDSPNQSITRTSSSTSTDWTLGGTLTVSNGTLTFGSGTSSGATRVGNLYVTGNGAGAAGGVLDMNSTTNVLNVTNATAATDNNVRLTNGGRLILSSGAAGTGGLNLNGSFTLADASTVFTPNNQTVGFLGSGTETITGLSTTPLAFYAININGGTASMVQLASNISVSNILSFNLGNMTTLNGSNAYTVDLLTTGSLSGESPNGKLTGFSSSTRTLGANSGANDFGTMGLTLTPQSSSDALGTTTVVRSRGVGYLTGASNSKSIDRNFRITPANNTGNFDVTLRIDYLDSEVPASTAEGNLQLFRSTDVQTYPTSGAGTFRQQNLTSLSQSNNIAIYNSEYDFGAGSTTGIVYTLGDQTNPLPVQLVTFTGTRTTGGVQLHWLTAQELQNAGFQVERQVAGGKWQAVQFLPGQGTGQGRTYSYLDATAPAGLVYYRLRQIDTDGTGSYSPVVAVNGAARLGAPALALYPVPTPADQARLTIDLSTLPAADRTLVLYDLQGRQLAQTTATATDATASLPVQALAAGSYLVIVRGNGETYHARFNKL